MRSINAISPEIQARPWEDRGRCSLLGLERDNMGSPTGGGSGTRGGTCIDPADAEDDSFGGARITTVGSVLQIYGPGNTLTGVVNAQGGGVSNPFQFHGGDAFTEGEGIAGHPAKWGYKRLPICKTTANAQKTGANGMTPAPDLATLLKDPKIEILILIIFLWWVLK